MIRSNLVYALLLMVVYCTTGKGQTKPDLQKENIKPETRDSITSLVPNRMVRI